MSIPNAYSIEQIWGGFIGKGESGQSTLDGVGGELVRDGRQAASADRSEPIISCARAARSRCCVYQGELPVSMIVIGSASHEAGVTTTALALAAAWPLPRMPLVVEADPTGGSLAARHGSTPHSPHQHPVHGAHCDPILSASTVDIAGVPVITAPLHPHRARDSILKFAADQNRLSHLRDHPSWVTLVDVGRLGPDSPALPLVHAADLLVICVAAGSRALADLEHQIPLWTSKIDARRIAAVLVGANQTCELHAVVGIPILGRIPRDQRAVAILTGRTPSSSRQLVTTRLGRAAVRLTSELAARLESLAPRSTAHAPFPAANEPATGTAPAAIPGPGTEACSPTARSAVEVTTSSATTGVEWALGRPGMPECPRGTIAVTGPGAADAIRALIGHAVTSTDPRLAHFADTIRIATTSADLHALTGWNSADTVEPHIEGPLWSLPTADILCRRLETELLRQREPVAAADGAAPAARWIVVVTAAPGTRTRWDAMPHYAPHPLVVILRNQNTADIHIGLDGTVTTTNLQTDHAVRSTRPAAMWTATELTKALVTTWAQNREASATVPSQSDTPAASQLRPGTASAMTPAITTRYPTLLPMHRAEQPDVVALADPPTVASPTPASPRPPEADPSAPTPTATGKTPVNNSDPPMVLCTIGPFQLRVGITVLEGQWRPQAQELLALLAAHRDGVTGPVLRDALWPDKRNARNDLSTLLAALRATLREATGLHHEHFIINARRRYQLDPRHFQVDLWHVSTVAEQLRITPDTAPAISFDEITALCRGSFVAGLPAGEWIHHTRHHIAQTITDMFAGLADLHAPTNPGRAAHYLEHALDRIDPTNEPLHLQTMRLHLAAGNDEAAHRVHAQLRQRLATIGTTPQQTTEHAISRLFTTRRSPLPPAGAGSSAQADPLPRSS